MKKLLLTLASAGLLAGSLAAHATPEQDRQQLLDHFKKAFPKVVYDDYVYGALAFDADSKAQYDSIMEFPPFLTDIEKGQKMWETPFKNGKTYASCLPNGGKNIAGNYPMFDDKTGKVVTLEGAINKCRTDNGEAAFDLGDMKGIGTLTSYMRTLSDGMLMNVKVEGPAATAAYEAGKHHFYARRGQLNFSCATCHVDNAGNRIRSEMLSPVLGQATHWPVFRGGDKLVTLHDRYQGCNKQVRAVPFKEGSEEYNNLEYFHSFVSNGLPMKASVFRK
ncbi:sulfur oxidation c-type cytochrome SoxA [Sulfurirhabdus autotrophica]|uniref:SoxAX cytochrome complex subunit A n=1 Tax=Sulfurirhabdus autotrophica TaxID=1706046 RepID=A0A4R3XUF9_9PROT|nr:sulfur oxidation c-type cytochrome SoxA [Sulfurirhabdus autotrophica]TCV82517.1 diheme cytochrome SoxA (sulfur oxidation) [Sulfurirhabdus autotrophica]